MKKRKAPNRSPNRGNKRQSDYENPLWKAKREEIFQRDGYKCQWRDCTGTSTELHCHHLKYFRGHLWETPNQFLITVCVPCHSKIHGRDLSRNLTKKPKRKKSGQQSG